MSEETIVRAISIPAEASIISQMALLFFLRVLNGMIEDFYIKKAGEAWKGWTR